MKNVKEKRQHANKVCLQTKGIPRTLWWLNESNKDAHLHTVMMNTRLGRYPKFNIKMWSRLIIAIDSISGMVVGDRWLGLQPFNPKYWQAGVLLPS